MVMAPRGEAELCSAGTDECVRLYACLAGAYVGIERGCFRGVPRFPRIDDTVIVVFNRQCGAAAEADIAYRLVAPGKPEILHLNILVMNFTFLCPECRILSWF